jgi:hypothetical protein
VPARPDNGWMEKGTRGEAAVHVDASPAEVYAAVSDVTRMGEWSPETVSCEWLDGTTGPTVGASFKGRNKRGIARWSTRPQVVAAEPGREFAFVVDDTTKWSFRCEPEGNGTRLVESFEMLADVPRRYVWAERYVMGIKDRRADLERGMAETIQRIKAAVERAPG